MSVFWDVFIDSVKDTLVLVPFLFFTYLVLEALEHGMGAHTEQLVVQAGKAGPLVGALLGSLPQCGFSAMAATLYAGRVVTVGTLVAVILSTSDEMMPVFLAHREPIDRLVAIIGTKVLIGIVMGFSVDVALRVLHRAGDGRLHISELCERASCGCDVDKDGDVTPGIGAGAISHTHTSRLVHIAKSALNHTIHVSGFIFLVTLLFGLLIELTGRANIAEILAGHPVRATLLAALVGLIPNCAASVTITELFLDGTLSSGPMLAGLLASGGVGLLVLWRTNADLFQNLVITAFVYAVGVVCGLMVGALGILF